MGHQEQCGRQEEEDGELDGEAASHNYMGRNYMGHNYIRHDYMGHSYMGHSYMAIAI